MTTASVTHFLILKHSHVCLKEKHGLEPSEPITGTQARSVHVKYMYLSLMLTVMCIKE